MKSKTTIKTNEITRLCTELRLPITKKSFESVARKSSKESHKFEDYLLALLELEYEQRLKNRKQARIRAADFPYRKYLEDLIIKELPELAQQKVPELSRLDFLKEGQNIVMFGNPGTGKTHMAIALGIKACMENYRVFYTTVPRLITQIRESRSEKQLRILEQKFKNYDLVICDEFGYISFDKEAAELLFTHLSLRAEKKSTIITTNLSFDQWESVFKDPVLTAAMVDRITHKAHLINMTGKSYRVKETMQQINQ